MQIRFIRVWNTTFLYFIIDQPILYLPEMKNKIMIIHSQCFSLNLGKYKNDLILQKITVNKHKIINTI